MILRDPVHGLVSFEAAEEQIVEDLLATPELQRLRRVRQLGFTSFAYPGADHTRFSHSLGAAHVMTRFVRRLRDLHHELPITQRVERISREGGSGRRATARLGTRSIFTSIRGCVTARS